MSELRDATSDDAPAVEAVWAAVAAEGEWIGTELPLRAGWQDRFREGVDDPSRHWFVVDHETDGVVGAVSVTHDLGIGHLGMAIIDGHRGRGLGKLLLSRAIDWHRGRGCHKVVLEVWPHNVRARGLYESMGFVDEGVLTRHYRRKSGALWDVVAMGLVLDTTSPAAPRRVAIPRVYALDV
jgi:RimJ/RimL family protein N-acetyltransferase